MDRERIRTTMAVGFMRKHHVRFTPHVYRYDGGDIIELETIVLNLNQRRGEEPSSVCRSIRGSGP